jgi:hypothetical protein
MSGGAETSPPTRDRLTSALLCALQHTAGVSAGIAASAGDVHTRSVQTHEITVDIRTLGLDRDARRHA